VKYVLTDKIGEIATAKRESHNLIIDFSFFKKVAVCLFRLTATFLCCKFICYRIRASPLFSLDFEIKIRDGEKNSKKFKRSYSKEWLEYIMVDELGELILPNYITTAFKRVLEKSELRVIRFHDLRHVITNL